MTLVLQADYKKDGAVVTELECEEGKKTVLMRLRSAWDCCRQTYYATLCAVLILVGCPMAAVGSQVNGLHLLNINGLFLSRGVNPVI